MTDVLHNETDRARPFQQNRPEWVRLHDATALFGLRRSSLYLLIREGAIKSVCVRRRGNVRGIRLISYDSLAGYIESMAISPRNKDQNATDAL